MRIRSDRRFHFELTAEEFWSRISDVDAYRDWWPWLRRFDARALAPGETWACAVKPPLPYILRFALELDDVVPCRSITGRIHGDITGTAGLEVDERDAGCDVRLTSELAPDNRYLAAVARVARPVVRFGHDWVLDTGARQFGHRA